MPAAMVATTSTVCITRSLFRGCANLTCRVAFPLIVTRSDEVLVKGQPECHEFCDCCSSLGLGPRCPQVRIGDGQAELALREVVPTPTDPIVEVVALRQPRFQQLTAKKLVN